jgi:peptidoglycan/xylan/chitin deacetylase (PgdA/CDA1 family)
LYDICDDLELRELKGTFLVVGRDLIQNPLSIEVFSRVLQRGHSLGNHTLNHLIDYHKVKSEDAHIEIIENHKLILQALDFSCVKFRAPGYNFRKDQLQNLGRLGYVYEDSSWSSPIIILINFYFKFIARNKKRITYSSNPKQLTTAQLECREILVIKWIRLPFHVTFFRFYPLFFIKMILKFKLLDGDIFLVHAKDYIKNKIHEKHSIDNFKKIRLVLDYLKEYRI